MKRLLASLSVLFLSVIPAFAPSASATSLTLGGGIAHISAYYADLFAAMGQPYHDPVVVILDDETDYTGLCGVATTGTGAAFYCPLDEHIVIDRALLDALTDADHENSGRITIDDDGLPYYVLAHEWGHHIQNLVGQGRSSHPKDWDEVLGSKKELEADCYAGAWMAYADGAGLWESDDLTDSVLVASQIGGGTYDPHGTGQQRASAVLRGFIGGIPACSSIDPDIDDTPVVPEATPLPTSADVSH